MVMKELLIVCDNGIVVVFKKPLNLLEMAENTLKHLGSTDLYSLLLHLRLTVGLHETPEGGRDAGFFPFCCD